ncbi:MAG: signal recognition particle protein [Clostridiales bacterium]|jgi:signal recognition particle subunit SRP54|nr:signal recognition particle protein [Clostridiales bacterium]
MALFESLSDKFKKVFAHITQRGKLSDVDIKQAMREIRVALLEADVNYSVVKDFVAKVSELAKGEEILKSLTPGQMVIKLVNEELTNLMGGENVKLEVSSKPPTVIMMVGLQGAGKTTMCGKLSKYLIGLGKKPLLVACDIYRPAAIKQLQVVGKNVGVEVFENGTNSPHKTAKLAVEYALDKGCDTVIIDTAGRLHINQDLMQELIDVKNTVQPTEILLTVDAMTGQDATTVATAFNTELDITGVILTKLDGDTRGGAALSIRAVTGKPIKLCGMGEKMGDLDLFHPDRMASRILGMGDVLTLIEKAQSNMSEQEIADMEKKFKEASFTLDDFLVQMQQMSKMGDLSQVMAMLPSQFKFNPNDLNETKLTKYKAIIQSMTMQERVNPAIVKASRRKRVALGSASSIQEVNALLKHYDQTKAMLKSMNGGKGEPNFDKLTKIRQGRGRKFR